jgi:putative chitinase
MTELLPLVVLQKLWAHGDQHVPGLLEGIAASAPAVLEKYGIATPLTVALMFGQFSEECGAGLEMQENMNYTAARLRQVFPTHFTATLAAKAAHNPQMIGEIAYGGRMGNAPPPAPDGYVYRGQGLSQLTGKESYQKLAEITGLDVVGDPTLLIAPDTALECAVADFVKLCECLPFAEQGDVLDTTKRLNGGTNGLAARQQWTRQWRAALGV